MSEHELERVRAMDSVVELLEDQVIRAAQWEYSTADTPQRPLPVPFADPTSWALTRITQRKIGDTTVKVCEPGVNGLHANNALKPVSLHGGPFCIECRFFVYQA